MRNLRSKVSVIIPAYNEAEHLARNIQEVMDTFNDFGCPYEIIIVDDGSGDDTYLQAQGIAELHPQVIVKRNFKNYGKGRALKKGFRHASGEYVVFLDADMDLHPGQLQAFLDIMQLEDADVVIGSKWHPYSNLNYPVGRKIVSLSYYFFVKFLFGLPTLDTQTGLKLFKRQVLQDVFPRILEKKFALDLEILVNAHHLGYKITEAPVVLNSRRGKIGRLGFKAMYNTLVDTLAIWYRKYIIRYYDRFDSHSRRQLE